MKTNKNILSVFIICLLLIFSLASAGCMQQNSEQTPNNEESTPDKSETIKLGSTTWDDGRATSNVFKHILESEGYNVELVYGDLGGVYQGLSDKDLDFYVSAWLPGTQGNYWDRYSEDLIIVNNLSSGARTGLVVPSYVPVDTINGLKEHRDKFDGQIQGIEPGAGIMEQTETAISEYNLDYKLQSSSTVAMSTELGDDIKDEEWIVVTLWNPHWSFSRMKQVYGADLKYLEDPKGVYGKSDNITMIAREGFNEDYPKIYKLASNANMDISEIESMMLDIENGVSPADAAQKWIDNNPEKVSKWLGE
ncbi:glycine betaine ABC transporter substrate-binding protein [Methanohalobium sp.]|uniref:glycine betaine ABC transporter substrate-binding protein n=1 Tax=Methanohalobium sp. TaxID=2837493 RepID=UPI0025F7EF67|nr:glycine betaine ABC transporter substrate-binding protein [Methanohalobium sp.]